MEGQARGYSGARLPHRPDGDLRTHDDGAGAADGYWRHHWAPAWERRMWEWEWEQQADAAVLKTWRAAPYLKRQEGEDD